MYMADGKNTKLVLDPIAQLAEWEAQWLTAMGGWFPGKKVILRGKNLFKDLSDKTWMGLLLFGITGRHFSDDQCKLFESIWRISTSFPDPRLWNNRVVTLAATARSTSNLGLAAGIAVSESVIFGHRPLLAAFNFQIQLKSKLAAGENLEELLRLLVEEKANAIPGSGKKRKVAKIPGFGRPITNQDERLEPLLEAASELGFDGGPHVSLIVEVEKVLQKIDHQKPLRMNVAALMAALCADQNLNAKEYYHYVLLCFTAGMLPCAIDALEKPEGSFFPLRCENIVYEGVPRRRWNRRHRSR